MGAMKRLYEAYTETQDYLGDIVREVEEAAERFPESSLYDNGEI